MTHCGSTTARLLMVIGCDMSSHCEQTQTKSIDELRVGDRRREVLSQISVVLGLIGVLGAFAVFALGDDVTALFSGVVDAIANAMALA